MYHLTDIGRERGLLGGGGGVKVFLCTGAPRYAPYSLLLISKKFWMWGGGGSRRGRIKGVEGLGLGGGRGWSRVIKFLYAPAPPPPTVWVLDLPTIHPVKVTGGSYA